MADFIVLGIVAVAVGAALTYIIKQKKKGVKCIGCPNSGSCSKCTCKNMSQRND